MPRDGWSEIPPNAWALRFLILAGGLLIMIPAVATGRLIEERLKNIDELRRREVQLERLSRRLSLALDSSRIGVWELNTETNALFWDDRVNELYGFPPDGQPRDYTHWERVIHPDDLQRVLSDSKRVAASGEAFQTQYRIVLPRWRDQAFARERHGLSGSRRADVYRRRELGRHRGRAARRKAEARQHGQRGAQFRAGGGQGAHRVQRAARFADRPAEPPLPRRRAGRPYRQVRKRRRTRRPAASRSRPLQADQRHAWPRGRRCDAGACRQGAESQFALRRFRRPRRRRRVRRVVPDRGTGPRALERCAGRPRRPHHRGDAPAGALSRP